MPRGRPPGSGWPAKVTAAAAALKRQQTAERIRSGKKCCSKCLQWKLIDEFSPAPSGRGDHRHAYCRPCKNQVSRGGKARRREAALAAAARLAAEAEADQARAEQARAHAARLRYEEGMRAAREARVLSELNALAGRRANRDGIRGPCRVIARCCGSELTGGELGAWWHVHHADDCPQRDWQPSRNGA
jgi:hypothetical protein